jgi:hypothetical protein
VYIASKTNENLPGNATHLEFDVSTDDIASLDLPNEIHGLVYCLGCECLRFRPAPTLLPFCSILLPFNVQNSPLLSRNDATQSIDVLPTDSPALGVQKLDSSAIAKPPLWGFVKGFPGVRNYTPTGCSCLDSKGSENIKKPEI